MRLERRNPISVIRSLRFSPYIQPRRFETTGVPPPPATPDNGAHAAHAAPDAPDAPDAPEAPEAPDAHDPQAGHEHPEPVEEHFGKGFFIVLALIPVTFALHKYATPSAFSAADPTGEQQPALLTRLIDKYSSYKDRWKARNDLHTRMVEQAAFDKNLFYNAKPSRTVELKFPEIFNTGSPYNVIAGWGGGNIDQVIEKYERQNREIEEKTMKRLAEKKAEERLKAEASSGKR